MDKDVIELEGLTPRRPVSKESREYTGIIVYNTDKDRKEKPWQRIPSPYIILVLGVYLLLGYLTQLVEDDMPRIIKETDVSRDTSDIFSEEAAWRYLDVILGDQPRVAGTKYHYQKTQDLKELLDQVAQQATLPVKTDWQFATGGFFLRSTFIFYHNLSNVAAVLVGESGFHSNGSIGSSILINCHFDSVPFALGTSDDGVFCAAMVETLSRLSRRAQPFKHNVIFLFNGAEENFLQGSHGFIQHPWFSGVKAVVNLEAAGMNGKAAVFQASDPRVLSAYSQNTYRPNAQSFGEFLFTSGAIPSDTDFRVWRDFGGVHGIDIAFAKWGHVYHTRYDHPSMLKGGVLQCAGDTLLRLVAALGDSPHMDSKVERSQSVYYDYLNTFVVRYSQAVATAVDVLVALFALCTVAYYVWLVGPRRSTVVELLWCSVGRLAAMFVGILVSALCVLLMAATTIQMRYLTQPWLVVAVYWMPYLIAAVCVAHWYDSWRVAVTGLSRSIRALQAQSATRGILAVVLLAMCCIPASSSARYAITVPLLLMSVAATLSLTLVRYFRMAAWQQLVLEMSLSIPILMFVFSTALRLNAMMIPIMGRSAANYPDYLVAMLNILLVILSASVVSGIELLFSRRHLWIPASILSVVCIVLMFIPFTPYQDEGPATQRHYWFHTEIVSYDINNEVVDRTTGILVTKQDPYTTQRVEAALREKGYNFNLRTDFQEDCEKHVYCNLPVFRTIFNTALAQSLFLYTSGPQQMDPRPRVTASRACVGETCTYTFSMLGGFHNTLTLWPRDGVNLTSLSTSGLSSPPLEARRQLDRPVYVLVHSTPTYTERLEPFVFEAKFLVPLSLQSQPVVDVSHHAHRIHHPELFTAHYRAVLAAMPAYFNVATFLSFRYNYVF